MAEIGELGASIPVKEVMSASVITVKENDSVELVAKLMDKHNIGSIIVVDRKGNPIGIITERDVAKRVVAKNLIPRKIRSKEIMSKPLVTIGPDIGIDDAAKKMSKLGIRRLVVMEKGKLAGIISSKDIISITPKLIELIVEKARISQVPPVKEQPLLAGYCDNCGVWSDALEEIDDRFLCEDCRVELGVEEV